MFSFSNKLYPITDVRISGLSHPEQVARLIAGGARLIQLREKNLFPREFYGEAKAAIAIARALGTRIIVNDRVDLAIALHADGVHLGQEDLPPEAARKLLGPDAIIGFSTHSFDQAQRASTMPIDYVAIGPIFATASKERPAPVVGLDGLRLVRRAVGTIPFVAIGGITLENAKQVISAGADAVAVISGILADPDGISSITGKLLNLL